MENTKENIKFMDIGRKSGRSEEKKHDLKTEEKETVKNVKSDNDKIIAWRNAKNMPSGFMHI